MSGFRYVDDFYRRKRAENAKLAGYDPIAGLGAAMSANIERFGRLSNPKVGPYFSKGGRFKSDGPWSSGQEDIVAHLESRFSDAEWKGVLGKIELYRRKKLAVESMVRNSESIPIQNARSNAQ